MDLKLDGKRALVTGSSSGIGVEIAKRLAAEGVFVAVHGRNEARAEKTAQAIARAGGRAVVATGDLTTDEGAGQIAATVQDAIGGVDILVNNAGGSGREGAIVPWDEITPDEYLDCYNLNVVAAVRLARRLAPGMVERGWGRIINISSAIARQGMGMMHEYAAAKAALENLSLNLSLSLAPKGVTVNTVVPGFILTDIAREYLEKLRLSKGWPTEQAELERRYIAEFAPQPIQRIGVPADIASAVAFLASPLADYATNAVLRIDGGMSRGL
jgi:NAD(P)-dependent dehydrogenase (short-subunit alcohol dehydrogenase family)